MIPTLHEYLISLEREDKVLMDKVLMDIEDIRKQVITSLAETTDHIKITRCFETLTGYRTTSSDKKNEKWVYETKH